MIVNSLSKLEICDKNFRIVFCSLFCMVFISFPSNAQLSVAWKRAEDFYERQRKDKIDDYNKSNNSSTNSSTGIIPSSPSYWGDGGAYQRRQAAYEAKVQAREDAYNAKREKFALLSSNVIKCEANYEILVKLAMEAGFDEYTAGRINGLYAPKFTAMTAQQAKVSDFNLLVNAAEADLAKNYVGLAIYKFGAALNYNEDPFIRKKYADLLFIAAEYLQAFEAYKRIELSQITPRPPKDENDFNTGKAALMAGDIKNAFLYLKQSWTASENYLNGMNLSYAYFLDGNYESAASIMKNELVMAQSFTDAALIEHFYLVKKGDEPTVKKFLETLAPSFKGLKISGNTSHDLALLLQAQAVKNVAADAFANTISLYQMDLAVMLDGENLDLRESRFAFNQARKRLKEAAIDEKVLTN